MMTENEIQKIVSLSEMETHIMAGVVQISVSRIKASTSTPVFTSTTSLRDQRSPAAM